MNFKTIIFLLGLSFFSATTIAFNADEWIFKEKKENLKSTPGCETKEKAIELAKSPYRFKKYTQMMCQHDGYGWTLNKIIDPGTPSCDECEGANKGKYSCYMSNVKVQCKTVKLGW